MEQFEILLNTYFNKPYRPEYLVEKVINEVKNTNYNFAIITKSENEIIKDNFDKIFIPILSDDKNQYESYVFNEEVKEGESIGNFKNLLYERCKLPYDKIDKKEILLYLFILEEFNNKIIDAIYQTVLDKSLGENIYNKLFRNFISIYKERKIINKNAFDKIYLTNYIKNEKSLKEIPKMNDLFEIDNIKINYLKYEYYGPEQTRYNYILNKHDENNQMTITLFSPDFLLEKKLLDKYDKNNFLVYNQNNNCPDLLTYILEEALVQLNNKINGEEINDDMISNFGIIHFEDQTAGLYLDVMKSQKYNETKNLIENLKKVNESDKLVVVCYSSSSKSEPKSENKSESESDQVYYKGFNSHEIEEQLSLIIINAIDKEVTNLTIERMPRIIFYFNLYIFKSQNEKQRIAFTPKENVYGFEEADGVFYLHSEKVNLTRSRDISFLFKARFVLTPSSDTFEVGGKSEIIIEEKSLIYMEVKNSFPLRYNNKKEIIGINETKALLHNIIRKSKKFYEIAKMQKKEIKQIHILFIYNSLLPKNEDMLKFIKLLQMFLQNLKVEIKIKTIFDIIYFVNPVNINMNRFSDIFDELKKQNEELKKKIIDLEANNKINESLINNFKKENEEANKKIIDLDANNKSNESLINNLKKENEKNQLEIRNLKIENEKLKVEKKEKINRLKEESQKKIDILLEKIKSLEKRMEEMTVNQKKNENPNNNQTVNNALNNINNNEDLTQINIINNDNDNDNNNNENNNDIITRINNKINENNEIIYNIQGLKNDAICFTTNKAVYIIKDNNPNIITLNGFRKVILQLKNGNILSSKNTNILIYSDNDFLNFEKINIKCYPKQIIELEEENQFLILNEDSDLILLQGETIIDKINNYKNECKISSIKEINSKEIVLLLEYKSKKVNKNKILIFYDLKNKIEIKRLELQSQPMISNDYDVLNIYNNYLYVSLFDSLFKIDIGKRTKIMRTSFGFSKIYRFGNNFFGIKWNIIYAIIDDNNNIQEKIIYEDLSKNIYCLYQTKEKKMILSTEKGIKYY